MVSIDNAEMNFAQKSISNNGATDICNTTHKDRRSIFTRKQKQIHHLPRASRLRHLTTQGFSTLTCFRLLLLLVSPILNHQTIWVPRRIEVSFLATASDAGIN